MPKKPTAEVTAPSLLETLKEALAPITERLEKLENSISKPITSNIVSFNEPRSLAPVPTENLMNIPVPEAYHAKVNTILNKNFGIELTTHPDAPVITLTIVVPDKYSTATEDQKNSIGGRDIRPKVITQAGGVNEVAEWCDLVFKSFSPEYQALITADRINQ